MFHVQCNAGDPDACNTSLQIIPGHSKKQLVNARELSRLVGENAQTTVLGVAEESL
jgi:hypothetical protein